MADEMDVDPGDLRPGDEPELIELPAVFSWNHAASMYRRDDANYAVVMGLSIISEQLDFMIRRMVSDG